MRPKPLIARFMLRLYHERISKKMMIKHYSPLRYTFWELLPESAFLQFYEWYFPLSIQQQSGGPLFLLSELLLLSVFLLLHDQKKAHQSLVPNDLFHRNC